MTRRSCVVVADGGRARLFLMEPGASPDLRAHPMLVERRSLVNAAVEVDAIEHSDDHGTGRRTLFRAGPTHGYEDTWDREELRLKATFAREVAEEAVRLATEAGVFEVVLVADPRMLGLLRRQHELFEKAHIRWAEHPRDFTKLPAVTLHHRLAEAGLVAPAVPMAAVA